ncbi:MFS transporter [Cytobacillus sp. IB215665]|uniref:MFS transporter n=1 Tax=Cytobacillus sp. IB215665 TaxID=3097357 RepID=UPI002A0BDC92|nr:MFS transporter [Cytobacillus sp. IB215665]MDX8364687.1 MFS transporter [Cytobacillus sp. IB215665]
MNTQRWMSRQFFSFFVTWGVFLPYWTGWMIHIKGMTISQTGLIMSLSLIARGISTLIVFPLLSGKLSSKTILNGASIGTLIVLLFCIPASSFTSLLVVSLLLHVFYPTLMPALDSAAGVLMKNNELKNYGKSRLWGSIGFVVAGIIVAIFIDLMGNNVILWAMLLGVIVFMILGFMQTPNVLSKKSHSAQTIKGGIVRLFRNSHFVVVLVIVILLQASHASYYNYGYIFLQEIHAPNYLIGFIINIAVIAEIIFFAIADKRFYKFSVATLLTLAALGSSIRWVIVFAFPNVIIFSISQILHAFSFAMAHYAFMKFLNKNIPYEQIPMAQGIYSGFALSWGTAAFTILGGYLYEIESTFAFIGMLFCTIPAILLAFSYRKLEHKTN